MREPTRIGVVRHVLGSLVTVELVTDLAGTSPIWEGHLQPIGQIGSLVRIPQGPITLLASVVMIGISELSGAPAPGSAPTVGDRWLQVQLLGELDALGQFSRGVSSFPGLDDEVHFATRSDLARVFPLGDDKHVRLGGLSAFREIPVALNASLLVLRHSAVVGSTGSGKTSAVSTLLQNFVHGGFTASNIVVIDPHGEYGRALGSIGAVASVMGSRENRLKVPYWAVPASDLLRILTGSEGATLLTRFSELVSEERRAFAATSRWLSIPEPLIAADTPVPFDLHNVWYRLAYENSATYKDGKDLGDVMLLDPGDAETLKPPQFAVPTAKNSAPYQGTSYGRYSVFPDRMRLKLSDERLQFFLSRDDLVAIEDPLPQYITQWLGNSAPISVLDLSGATSEATDLSVGIILDTLFQLATHSSKGIGKGSPVLVVLEEAHRYLGDSKDTQNAKTSVNRIAREGRKYGLGIMLISQRPSELPETALSQVGTVVALRLTNGADQSCVKKALPDSLQGLADALPSLRTGEAIVSGEATTIPARSLIDAPNPRPQAEDPPLSPWRSGTKALALADAIAEWRGAPEKRAQ
ncbi:MAG TPA: ATP-binding protein [Candidatus Sulfotelmatobacter sp.]|nr:ATP-binding protein [Candidatus Sulfotelmatobacter sp.]